jgi:hypothetical protein
VQVLFTLFAWQCRKEGGGLGQLVKVGMVGVVGEQEELIITRTQIKVLFFFFLKI